MDRCTDISHPLPWSTECVRSFHTLWRLLLLAAVCTDVEYRQAANGDMFTGKLKVPRPKRQSLKDIKFLEF